VPALPEAIWRRRLESEHQELKGTGIDFEASGDHTTYLLRIRAPGYEKSPQGVKERFEHEVRITLKREYPYPGGLEVGWITPIFHPNIRASDGRVCLHLLTHWGAAITLAELSKGLQHLLENPNPADPLDKEAASWFAKKHGIAAPAQPPRQGPRVVR
jgi:ubiquitin-protein ligase